MKRIEPTFASEQFQSIRGGTFGTFALKDLDSDATLSSAIQEYLIQPGVIGTSIWLVPSKPQWEKLISSAGGYVALRDGFSSVGGTNMETGSYWTSTYWTTNDSAYYINLNDGKMDETTSGSHFNNRACIAF